MNRVIADNKTEAKRYADQMLTEAKSYTDEVEEYPTQIESELSYEAASAAEGAEECKMLEENQRAGHPPV